MRKNHLKFLVLAAVLSSVCVSAFAQQPPAPATPTIDIPEAELRGGALQTRVAQIDAYIDYWAKQIQAGKDEDAITAARAKILAGYTQYDVNDYKSIYVAEAIKYLTPIFGSADALKNLRQVNAGLAISRMPQLSVQPALERMTAEENPALRYYAWIGYREIRGQVLAQNKIGLEKMYKLLATAMPKETAPATLRAMMDVLDLSVAEMATINADNRDFAQQQSYQIFTANWPALCNKIIAGQDATAFGDPARSGAGVIAYLGVVYEADKVRQTALLQAAADMMHCASVTYGRSLILAARSDVGAQAQTSAQANAEMMNYVLRDLETALNAATKKTNSYLRDALTNTRIKDPAAFAAGVELAGLKWLDELKAFGVVPPKYVAPATTATSSAPTTKP